VPWLDLGEMEAEGRASGCGEEGEQLEPLFAALPHAPFHGLRLPEAASRAVEGLHFRVPL
jgi:hypothetical protein